METILVTGGAGFIGRAVSEELLRRGHRVRVLDSLIEQVHGAQPGASMTHVSINLVGTTVFMEDDAPAQ